MGTLDLNRKWRTDPWLDDAETLEPTPRSTDDYRGVGTGDTNDPNSSRYDRGHQAPLASVKGSRFASQVNYYSNITPQRPNLNQGPWRELEDKVRDLVEKYQQVWVMTDPLYERPMPPLPHSDEAHTVPSGYWKIIAIEDSGTLRVAGFIMDQQTDRDSPVIDHLVIIDEIESRSNLDFFWKVGTA